jgi:N-acetylgalactosamine kinase
MSGADRERRAYGWHEADRIDALSARFRQCYGRRPQFVVSAPGRVNLIGEHTDYNALPVLPMAIDRNILVACAEAGDRRIRLHNTDPRFRSCEYDLADVSGSAKGDWERYHMAAVRGVMSLLGTKDVHGGDFLFDGTIPSGSGLSSSSALVVASALGLLAVHDRKEPALRLAELMAAAERFVGTQSGGMDQAVCLLAEAEHALRIDFDPLRARPVRIPPGCSFIVCHSTVTAEKSGAAQAAYNHRVLECTLACRALENALADVLPRSVRHFGDLVALLPERSPAELIAVLASSFPRRPLDEREVSAAVGGAINKLFAGTESTSGRERKYALLQRATHILTEAERVESAEAALLAGDWSGLGALMDASHASCRDDYEVSCAELEELVAAAKQAGALGARLTGAGFGGCTVNLVRTADVPLFCTMLERTFYHGRGIKNATSHCFDVVPSAGARVVRVAGEV